MNTISDATWLLLWQIWRTQEDFHGTKALVHRVLDLEVAAEIKPVVSACATPAAICVCGQYSVCISIPRCVLLAGCCYCDTAAEEVSAYTSWIYHVLAAEYDIVLTQEKVKESIAKALSQYKLRS